MSETKAQIIEQLKALGVEFDPDQTKAVLQGLLEETLAKQTASTPIQEEPDAQTFTQQDIDGQPETQPDPTPENPEQEQDQGQDPNGQQSADPISAPESVVPPAVDPESDTPSQDPEPEFVRVRLGADSPVGRLVIPGYSGFDRRQTAVISRVAFDEHKGEYLIEEVTD